MIRFETKLNLAELLWYVTLCHCDCLNEKSFRKLKRNSNYWIKLKFTHFHIFVFLHLTVPTTETFGRQKMLLLIQSRKLLCNSKRALWEGAQGKRKYHAQRTDFVSVACNILVLSLKCLCVIVVVWFNHCLHSLKSIYLFIYLFI